MLACQYLSYRTEDKVPLNALLWEPAAPRDAAVILVPGFNGTFHQGHDYQPIATMLTGLGYAFMAPNLRTAGDFTDPRVDDVVPDIAAAIAAAHERGYRRVALFGTSVGGPRSAYFLARRADPSIECWGLIAPIMSPYGEAQLRFDERERARLEAFLAECRMLLAQGASEQPVRYRDWFPGRHVTMTARGFLQMFGTPEDTPLSAVRWAPSITLPTLILHGTKDVVSLPPNSQAIHDALTAAPRRDLVWVTDATHVLQRGHSAQAYATEVANWLPQVMRLD